MLELPGPAAVEVLDAADQDEVNEIPEANWRLHAGLVHKMRSGGAA